jgi:glycosyltransferase involved in cell wall biosynthesis
MKILYFYQYFSTPKGSWGTRVYEYAREWVKKGHEVTVVTSIYSKSDITAEKLIEYREVDGIQLIILNISIDNKQHPVKRIWTFVQYSFLASWFALKSTYDIAIVSSGPITVGIPGLLAKKIKRKKVVFEVRDLWPGTAIALGFIKYKWMQKAMYAFEKICYRNSDLIVTLSPGSKENIEERYGRQNIISVPNSANIKLFGNNHLNTVLPKGLVKNRYAIYTGNIGPANNSRMLFEAAQILKKEGTEDFRIVLVGDGQEKKVLQDEAEEQGLQEYFTVIDLMPKEQLVPLVKHSLVSLIPMANRPLLDTSSPNKLFESLAAGVPVVQTTNGWIKELLDKESCGFTITPENPEELVDILKKLKADPGMREKMAENAFNVAKTQFDKTKLAQKMIGRIELLNS